MVYDNNLNPIVVVVLAQKSTIVLKTLIFPIASNGHGGKMFNIIAIVNAANKGGVRL